MLEILFVAGTRLRLGKLTTKAACLFWAEEERNRVVFEREQFSQPRLKNSFVFALCSWAPLIGCSDSLFIRKLMILL